MDILKSIKSHTGSNYKKIQKSIDRPLFLLLLMDDGLKPLVKEEQVAQHLIPWKRLDLAGEKLIFANF